RDADRLASECAGFAPEVLFHLASQSLVRRSYRDPVETFGVNVMGTANILEAARGTSSLRSIVIVTSDKCYENREWAWGYREADRLGGSDPYGASKACAELVTSAYQRSFFSGSHAKVGIATVRAGNVIGGGDWGEGRVVPDTMRAFAAGERVALRNPAAVRPWQYVLEPLRGYLRLAELLYVEPQKFGGPWNFGPREEDAVPVATLVEKVIRKWGSGEWHWKRDCAGPPEAQELRLDSTRAGSLLGWRLALNLDEAVEATVNWYRKQETLSPAELYEFSSEQLLAYESRASRA